MYMKVLKSRNLFKILDQGAKGQNDCPNGKNSQPTLILSDNTIKTNFHSAEKKSKVPVAPESRLPVRSVPRTATALLKWGNPEVNLRAADAKPKKYFQIFEHFNSFSPILFRDRNMSQTRWLRNQNLSTILEFCSNFYKRLLLPAKGKASI